ncbi:uncharacterized protein LOC127803304 [Diospyros lotus]|uniref:uncharacterized protein LOC127803304 n=1 Tax=Diospyros lotus TaxID=55363 RepID=UPI00224D0375|nr:uncharacterized protein LOC127803304 [Diospyros lotus]
MLRALSRRASSRGYERLGEEPSSAAVLEAKLKRVTSSPAKFLGSLRKSTRDQPKAPANSPAKQAKKVSKIHPLFSLFVDKRRKKAATAKPEFARYMEYLKEGGSWDVNSNAPVMYYA